MVTRKLIWLSCVFVMTAVFSPCAVFASDADFDTAAVVAGDAGADLASVVDVQKYNRSIHIMAMLVVGFGFLMVFGVWGWFSVLLTPFLWFF